MKNSHTLLDSSKGILIYLISVFTGIMPSIQELSSAFILAGVGASGSLIFSFLIRKILKNESKTDK